MVVLCVISRDEKRKQENKDKEVRRKYTQRTREHRKISLRNMDGCVVLCVVSRDKNRKPGQ